MFLGEQRLKKLMNKRLLKMNEEEINNESRSDKKQGIGMSRTSRCYSSSKLQPERIMMKIEMMESDDDEDDNNDNNYNNDDNQEEEETDKNIDEDVAQLPKVEEFSRKDKEKIILPVTILNLEEEEKYDKLINSLELDSKQEPVNVGEFIDSRKSSEKYLQEQRYFYEKFDRNNELKSISSSVVRFSSDYGRTEVDNKSPVIQESSSAPGVFPGSLGTSSRSLEVPSGTLVSDSPATGPLPSQSSGISSISTGMSSLSTEMCIASSQSQIHDLLTSRKPERSILSTIAHTNKESNIKYGPLDTHISSSHDSYISPPLPHKSEPGIINSNVFQSTLNPPVTSFKLEPSVPVTAVSQPAINQPNISQNTPSNNLPLETPIKHQPAVGSMRPVPSYSHRNIFQTPQNKMTGSYSLNQSYAPTPATIFSHWQNMMHTPVQNNVSDPGVAHGSSIVPKHEPYWYKNIERKGIRRPLAETMFQEPRTSTENSKLTLNSHDHHENQSHTSLEVSNRLQIESQVRFSVDNQNRGSEASRHCPLENQSRLPLENQNRALLETQNRPLEVQNRGLLECNIEKPLKSSVLQELKENKHPTLIKNFVKKDESLKRIATEFILDNNQANRMSKPESSAAKELFSNLYNAENKVNIVASVSGIKKFQIGKKITVKGVGYIILGKLGEGMSGQVYRVQNLTNFELRAIKCVDLSKMDKENAQSCVQEIEMLSKLQGPSIIQMFDFEINNHMIYVVMEMGDTDLSKLLKSIVSEKRHRLEMVVYYWTEMLTAVKFIHDNGVIHSDLKPANFLLVRGRLKLIDFGIASTLNGDMTSVVKNTTVGTLNYISPEALMDVGESPNQNSKFKINYKSDVWSLGCILYSLVFGRTPFQDLRQHWAKVNAITNPASKISYDQPPNSDPIPSILIDVIKKCLQHNPKERPSVEQLLQIHYVPIGNQSRVPDIPPIIIKKIKNSLNDEEWRQFIEIMDQRKNH